MSAVTKTRAREYAYVVRLPDLPMINDFVQIERVTRNGKVRLLVIDLCALDGVLEGLLSVALMRERARIEAEELLSRLART